MRYLVGRDMDIFHGHGHSQYFIWPCQALDTYEVGRSSITQIVTHLDFEKIGDPYRPSGRYPRKLERRARVASAVRLVVDGQEVSHLAKVREGRAPMCDSRIR
jgi:hypothetical protein